MLTVFSGNTPLPVELLRIGAITLLYLLSIFGWGQLLCRAFNRSEIPFQDFIATRLVMGCLALYSLFVLLSAGGFLHRGFVGVVLITGLVCGLVQTLPLARKW